MAKIPQSNNHNDVTMTIIRMLSQKDTFVRYFNTVKFRKQVKINKLMAKYADF